MTDTRTARTVDPEVLLPCIVAAMRAQFGRWFDWWGPDQIRDDLSDDPTGDIPPWSVIVAWAGAEALDTEPDPDPFARASIRTSWRLTAYIPADAEAPRRIARLGHLMLCYLKRADSTGWRGHRWTYDLAVEDPENCRAEPDDPGLHGLMAVAVTWDQILYGSEEIPA